MKENNKGEKRFQRFIDWVNGDLEGEKKFTPVKERVYTYDQDKNVLISKRSDKLYKVFSVVFTLAIIAILLFTVPNSPKFGSEDSPAMNEVSLRYVEEGPEETGAVNAVAGLILDYRAFDTFGEAVMLFTAAMATVSLLKNVTKEERND